MLQGLIDLLSVLTPNQVNKMIKKQRKHNKNYFLPALKLQPQPIPKKLPPIPEESPKKVTLLLNFNFDLSLLAMEAFQAPLIFMGIKPFDQSINSPLLKQFQSNPIRYLHTLPAL